MVLTSEKPLAQTLEQRVLATYCSIGFGITWAPRQWRYFAKPLELKNWKRRLGQGLPDVRQTIFYHAEYNCMLVVYVDDFKLAGPTENMEKALASIRRAVNIGEPESYDRYLVVNMWSSTMLHFHERLTLLHMFLTLRRLLPH